MTTTQKSAVQNEVKAITLTVKEAVDRWDEFKLLKLLKVSINDTEYLVTDKPLLCKNKAGDRVFKLAYGGSKSDFSKIVKPDFQLYYTQKTEVVDTPKKQQIIIDENDIDVSFLETLARQLPPYEVLELSQKLLAIAMDTMNNPAKTNKPDAIANTPTKKPDAATNNTNGKKPDAIANTPTNKPAENKETRGRKSVKTYALYWEQFNGYGIAKKQGLTDQAIADKYGVGKATVTEELRTHAWLTELSKTNKPAFLTIVKNWKSEKTTFSMINGAVKSGLNKSKPKDAIAMAIGEKKLSYEEAVSLAKS